MMASCKNNKTTEPTPEEIQAQKVALADSVLAQIDAFASEYITSYENGVRLHTFELTETEKLIKPDYLLDPKAANTFATKSQKVNALAIYIVDYGVRKIYEMPLEEAKEAIAKLAVDVNFPFDTDQYEANAPLSERIKAEYKECKERGDLAYFWQFENAIIKETYYIIVQNPELFFNKITEEQWQEYIKATNKKNAAMRELAKYDEEMADVLEIFNRYRVPSSDEDKARVTASFETCKQHIIADKDKFIANRNVLLQ